MWAGRLSNVLHNSCSNSFSVNSGCCWGRLCLCGCWYRQRRLNRSVRNWGLTLFDCKRQWRSSIRWSTVISFPPSSHCCVMLRACSRAPTLQLRTSSAANSCSVIEEGRISALLTFQQVRVAVDCEGEALPEVQRQHFWGMKECELIKDWFSRNLRVELDIQVVLCKHEMVSTFDFRPLAKAAWYALRVVARMPLSFFSNSSDSTFAWSISKN